MFGMPIHSAVFMLLAPLLIGAVCGMRTFLSPAILALVLSRRPELVPAVAPAHWFTHPAVAVALVIISLGELVGDKLPQTPNRTALAPFLARTISGAICGAAVAQVAGGNVWTAVMLGCVGAAAATFGMFHARRSLVRITRIPDPYVAAAEDVLGIVIAAAVIVASVS